MAVSGFGQKIEDLDHGWMEISRQDNVAKISPAVRRLRTHTLLMSQTLDHEEDGDATIWS